MAMNIIEKSRAYIQEGKFEKARIILRRALNENPRYAKAVELFGDLCVKLGRSDEAIGRYEHASDIYSNNKKYNEAILCLEKILKIDKTKNELFFRIADLYKSIGFPNETIKKLLELCSWALENREEATFISGLKKIVNLQPKNLVLRLSFVKILFSIDRSQEAEDELSELKALAEKAHDENILAEIAKLLPQCDGGEEELDPRSRIELGKLLYEIGSKDEALVEFKKAVDDLLKAGENDEAIKVLNHIVEIDPDNSEAKSKIEELKPEQVEIEEVVQETQVEEQKPTSEIGVEETSAETAVEEKKEVKEMPAEEVKSEVVEEVTEKETPDKEGAPGAEVEEAPEAAQEGIEFLQELSNEVEGYVAATEATGKGPAEGMPPLEGQIADIEFLLKEAEETLPGPSFETAQSFDDFQSNIIWEKEDAKKKLTLAKEAFEAELYEAALGFTKDIKDNKKLWPQSLELIGGSLIKLGHYNDAIKALGSAIFSKEIPEAQKIELRYLFASAYEGLGDFENALRETEHIMGINSNYKDVKEIYELLGGKQVFEETPAAVEKKVPTPTPIKPAPVEAPPKETKIEIKEGYPTIEEPLPEKPESEAKEPKKLPEEISEIEEKGEKISFL